MLVGGWWGCGDPVFPPFEDEDLLGVAVDGAEDADEWTSLI